MTVIQLIKGSLRLVQGLGVGRGIENSGSIAADCLFSLNALLDTWRTERLLVPHITETTYTWPAGTSSRTIGTGGQFNATRPVRIESAVLVNGDSRTLLDMLTRERYLERRDGLYSNGAAPLSTLYLLPVPTASVSLELSTWTPISAFAAVTDTIVLPDGYEAALLYNLALELAPLFPDTMLTDHVITRARETKAAIKRLNMTWPELACDAALLSRGEFDITTGSY